VTTQSDHPQYSNNAQVELTRQSIGLEAGLEPITRELNSQPLRVNPVTWQRNLESAEEAANFLIDYTRFLANDDTFRPNSSGDCARILFKDRQPKLSKTSGRPLTDKDTLSELANEGITLAGAVLDARSAISRWSQMKAWEPYAKAGLVWSYWDSLGTPHGRYTSDGPCLTNRIPEIRETIEPPEGYSFLSLDLSQAEYVTWASLSNDQVLATAFLTGKDFHVEMAQSIRKAVPTWDLRGQCERDAGKTVNFAVLYQMQPHTLARKLGCSVEIASRIVSSYYKRVPCARRYIDHVLAQAEALGHIETFYGRRRYCPEYQTKISDREAHEIEKTLWNHHNAGTAAELLKFKQLKVWNALRDEGLNEGDVRLSLQMFDELVFTVHYSVLSD
jgi:DNA polymerase I